MKFPNLLIIAGTGNKSGKTTIACRLIEKLKHQDVVAVKITPHFHETTPGLIPVSEGPGFSIYEETDSGTMKDTSRMLNAGAAMVYFAKVNDQTLLKGFMEIIRQVHPQSPVICESPALRHFVEPGMFVIMTSESVDNRRDIRSLQKLPHVEFDLDYLDQNEDLPVSFSNGKWLCWRYGD